MKNIKLVKMKEKFYPISNFLKTSQITVLQKNFKIHHLFDNLKTRKISLEKQERDLNLQKMNLGLEYKALKQYKRKEKQEKGETQRYFDKK